MKRNPSPHEIQARVPYLSIKPDCKWAGVILNNVVIEQGIVYSEKDIEKLVSRFKAENTEKIAKWVDRCTPTAGYLEMINAMEAEIKELRAIVSQHHLAK